jgi:hypothetical protein
MLSALDDHDRIDDYNLVGVPCPVELPISAEGSAPYPTVRKASRIPMIAPASRAV